MDGDLNLSFVLYLLTPSQLQSDSGTANCQPHGMPIYLYTQTREGRKWRGGRGEGPENKYRLFCFPSTWQGTSKTAPWEGYLTHIQSLLLGRCENNASRTRGATPAARGQRLYSSVGKTELCYKRVFICGWVCLLLFFFGGEGESAWGTELSENNASQTEHTPSCS